MNLDCDGLRSAIAGDLSDGNGEVLVAEARQGGTVEMKNKKSKRKLLNLNNKNKTKNKQTEKN